MVVVDHNTLFYHKNDLQKKKKKKSRKERVL